MTSSPRVVSRYSVGRLRPVQNFCFFLFGAISAYSNPKLFVAGSSSEAVNFVSTGAAMIVRMRGLPYDCSEQQILIAGTEMRLRV
ncbi:hypothetical protein ANCDUO_09484 [Ancylostoma duodenale]|uniref:Uncharacterized protein n=1 Tax=Ancylostoma duodenale TaxID=51022 RepID=A0A0C2DCU9_9BILA|nr:hypothetical protein ANCDUO_09484 [Ancylostoma duodenale]